MSIGDRVKMLRERMGLSQPELAARLGGVKQQSINQLERNKVERPRYLLELASVLGVDPRWLETGLGAGPDLPHSASTENAEHPPTNAVILPDPPVLGPKDLPVYGAAEGGPAGAMLVTMDPIEWVRRPEPLLQVKGAYAVYVVGDSMSPAYEQGDMILVHPAKPPRGGDDVLLCRHEPDGRMHSLVKRLLRASEGRWRVRQYNPPKEFDLPKTEWQRALLIVGKYHRR